MKSRRIQSLFSMAVLPVMVVFIVLSTILVTSCESDKPPIAPAVRMRDSIPVMTTYGVSKLISDSGVIRYKIVAEEWKVYDRTNPPRQTFEKGLLLEKFNLKYRIEMYVTADTAYWYNQSLWELRGRVCVWNEDGVIFRSQLLYWDMDSHEFYSNKYSHLITPDREVEGHSFHSNEQMTRYEVNVTQASFPIPSSGESVAEPASTDTTQAETQTLPERTFSPRAKQDVVDPTLPKGHFK